MRASPDPDVLLNRTVNAPPDPSPPRPSSPTSRPPTRGEEGACFDCFFRAPPLPGGWECGGSDGMDSSLRRNRHRCAIVAGVNPKEESAMKSTTIAVDLAKNVFQVAVSHHPGKVAESHRLSRSQFLRFLAERQ